MAFLACQRRAWRPPRLQNHRPIAVGASATLAHATTTSNPPPTTHMPESSNVLLSISTSSQASNAVHWMGQV